MSGRFSAGATLAAVVRQLGGQVLLTLEDIDDVQALVLLEHETEPELVLGAMDRESGIAAVLIEREGVQKLRDALTGWLEAQP